IAEQEICKRISVCSSSRRRGPPVRKCEAATRRVRIDGAKFQMKPGGTEFELVSPSVDEEIVIHIETFVRPVNKARGIAYRALHPCKSHLRITGISGIGIDAAHACAGSEVVCCVNAGLTTRYVQITKPNFVQNIRRKEMRVVQRKVIRFCTDVSTEAVDKRLVQRTRAKRLECIHVVETESAKQTVLIR